MEFDKLFDKYMAGTCTEDEKAFVDGEIEKARKVADTLLAHQPVTYKPVEDALVERAQKHFNTRILLRVLIITVATLLLAACITLAVIFGPAVVNARSHEDLTRQEAADIALEFACDYAREYCQFDGQASDVIIKDVDRDLEWVSLRRNSVYIYEFELIVSSVELDVVVNTATGAVRVRDVDYHGLSR